MLVGPLLCALVGSTYTQTYTQDLDLAGRACCRTAWKGGEVLQLKVEPRRHPGYTASGVHDPTVLRIYRRWPSLVVHSDEGAVIAV